MKTILTGEETSGSIYVDVLKVIGGLADFLFELAGPGRVSQLQVSWQRFYRGNQRISRLNEDIVISFSWT